MKFIENPGDAAVASFGLLAHIDEESRRELFSKGFGASAPAVEEAEKFVEFNLFTTRIRAVSYTHLTLPTLYSV